MTQDDRERQLREAAKDMAARWAAGERISVAELNEIERLCWAEPGQGIKLERAADDP